MTSNLPYTVVLLFLSGLPTLIKEIATLKRGVSNYDEIYATAGMEGNLCRNGIPQEANCAVIRDLCVDIFNADKKSVTLPIFMVI